MNLNAFYVFPYYFFFKVCLNALSFTQIKINVLIIYLYVLARVLIYYNYTLALYLI